MYGGGKKNLKTSKAPARCMETNPFSWGRRAHVRSLSTLIQGQCVVGFIMFIFRLGSLLGVDFVSRSDR